MKSELWIRRTKTDPPGYAKTDPPVCSVAVTLEGLADLASGWKRQRKVDRWCVARERPGTAYKSSAARYSTIRSLSDNRTDG